MVSINDEEKCRICSKVFQDGILVFSEEGEKLYLQAKIHKYLYITITNEEKLPKIICMSCFKKLEYFHNFATMASESQKFFNKTPDESNGLLRTYLTKGVKDEMEVTEIEINLDPMLVLQYALEDDDDDADDDQESSDVETDHKIKTNSKKPYRPFKCNYCTRRFMSEIALQSHNWYHFQHKTRNGNEIQNMRMKIRGSACPICAKIISNKSNLKVHLETHRPKGKHACEICGRIFKTQFNLIRHKEYHKGIQYPCSVCGRVYPTNSTLKAHSITHSNLRPHQCSLCEKSFKRNQDLKFHINQHTGARPYQCPYCPKAFASSGNCFSHRKRMHPMEVERDKEIAQKVYH